MGWLLYVFISFSEGPLAPDDSSVAESESIKAASSLCVGGEEELGEEESPGEEGSGKPLPSSHVTTPSHSTR